tara:strand:+ start:963 stop:1700 length:738 start_codon:yes stop_codon:yes gene_type:complete
MSGLVIEPEAVKRLAKDVKQLIKNPLDDNRIFYKHNEDNILLGKALIIGPQDTPYENGFYLFEFEFPPNYPHSPPKVTYHTNDGLTRFNPNLYRNGKVCISILNTWKGDQWSSCQTITSVLLTLCTVLNDKPLLNEPGVKETDSDMLNYNRIIRYKNIKVGIIDVLEKKYFRERFSEFREIFEEEFRKNYKNLMKKIEESSEDDGKVIKTTWYSCYDSMGNYKPHMAMLNYEELISELEALKDKV